MGFIGELFSGGGSKSTTTNSMLTSTAVSAISNNIMSCSGNQMMIQNFILAGNGNSLSNIKQIQSLKLSTECAQSSQNLTALQQEVTAALTAAASVNTQAVLSALSASSESDVNTKIENDVKQNITQNTILKIINDTNLQQNMIISGNANVINNFTQEQTTDILNKNIQNAINKIDSVQKIASKTDAKSTNTQSNPLDDMLKTAFKGVNDIADTVGSVFSSGMYTVAAVIIVGMIVAGYFFGPAIISFIQGGPLGAMLGGPSSEERPAPPPASGSMSMMGGPPPPYGQPPPPMGPYYTHPQMAQPQVRGGIPNYVKV